LLLEIKIKRVKCLDCLLLLIIANELIELEPFDPAELETFDPAELETFDPDQGYTRQGGLGSLQRQCSPTVRPVKKMRPQVMRKGGSFFRKLGISGCNELQNDLKETIMTAGYAKPGGCGGAV